MILWQQNTIYAAGPVLYLRIVLEAAILMKVIPCIFGNRKCDIIPVLVIRKLRVRETMLFIQNKQLVWELGWRSISDSHISESVWHKRNEQLTLEEHSSLCHTLYQLPRWALKFSHIHYSHISNCEYSLEESGGLGFHNVTSLSEIYSFEFMYWIAGNILQYETLLNFKS